MVLLYQFTAVEVRSSFSFPFKSTGKFLPCIIKINLNLGGIRGILSVTFPGFYPTFLEFSLSFPQTFLQRIFCPRYAENLLM